MMSRLKTTAGAAIVAGLVAIPVVATAAPYPAAMQSQVILANNAALATYGSQPQIKATVTGVDGTPAPQGTISFSVSPSVTGTSSAQTVENGNDLTRTFTFPADAPAGTTYTVSASFTTSNTSTYNSSVSPLDTNVTMYKATTAVNVGTVTRSTNDRSLTGDFTVSVTSAGSPALPAVAPTVQCGSVVGTVSFIASTGAGTFSCSVNQPTKFTNPTTVTVTYPGNSNFEASNGSKAG